MTIPTITLLDGNVIPQLGYGVWQIPDEDAEKLVSSALEVGYRSIDTAAIYGNEAGVGRAVQATDVPREDIFVTTKLWNADQGYDATLKAFEQSYQKLGLEYIDLYLIHWPVPQWGKFADTFKAFQKLRDDGRVKSIGVSNFLPEHLDQLISEVGEKPVINQIELHPRLIQEELRTKHLELGIATEAWSPLGGSQAPLIDDETIVALANKLAKSPAQVVLRWHIQLGNVVIPKSSSKERQAQNLDIFDFTLSDEDVQILSGLHTGTRVGPDPAEFGLPQ